MASTADQPLLSEADRALGPRTLAIALVLLCSAGCGRAIQALVPVSCDSPSVVAALIKDPRSSLDNQRAALACAVARAQQEQFCPVPSQESWRSADALLPIALALASSDSDIRRAASELIEPVVSCQTGTAGGTRHEGRPRPNPEAEAAFMRALRHGDPQTQVDAIIGVGIVGAPASTNRVLTATLAGAGIDSGVRRAAAEMLTLRGDESSVDGLAGILNLWDTPLQEAALVRLSLLGPVAAPAVPAIVKVLREGPLPLQASAATAAAAICRDAGCGGEAATAIVDSFGRGTGGDTFRGDQRLVALAFLGADALAPLQAALSEPRGDVRKVAADAMRSFSTSFEPPTWRAFGCRKAPNAG